MPPAIFGEQRQNSAGINIDIASEWTPFHAEVQRFLTQQWQAGPVINGVTQLDGDSHHANDSGMTVTAPYDRRESVGHVAFASAQQVDAAITVAQAAYPAWANRPVAERAACLVRLADLLEAHTGELVALCHREAGKTLHDGIDEIREAVDFCRFYAQQASQQFAAPQTVTGYDGTVRTVYQQGRGVFACISRGTSRWRFFWGKCPQH
ncbi:proline dehydrogenase [Photobacterium aphoticum]|uniref:Proline dehydrogenase n=1 Tax=Photobacterium aphoticum TaxID=754436 RepID=A0A090QMW1_9GAMM|nr:proline dehydrogenase [Photobacterium aphoticum]